LARAAAPAGLKQLEGFLLVAGPRPELLAALTEGFCGWGAGFLQDEWETEVFEHGGDGAALVASTRQALGRCANYAAWQLPSPLDHVFELDGVAAEAALRKAARRDAVPLYWMATAHAVLLGMTGEISLGLRFPRMVQVLRRVLELEPEIDHGQAHALLGVLLAAAPVFGDLEEGKRELDRARQISGGRLLLVDVLTARSYAVARRDRALFTELLTRVLTTAPSIWPQERLSNELAHRMARRYLKVAARWF
jgi:TRAP transporter T-component